MSAEDICGFFFSRFSIVNNQVFPLRRLLFFSTKYILSGFLPSLFNRLEPETVVDLKIPTPFVLGWGDQLIWTQTYEEALYKSKTR